MVTKKKEKGKEKRGKGKAGDLKRNKETGKELSDSDMKKVAGGMRSRIVGSDF